MPSPSPSNRRGGPLLYAAIFLIGAPIGVLMMMIQETPQGWLAGLVSAVFAGAVSVGWAYSFIRERLWLLVPLIPGSLTLPNLFFRLVARTNYFDVGLGLSPQLRLIVLSVMCVLFTAAGFICFVVHLRMTERRGARAHAELDLAREVHRTLVPPLSLSTPFAEVHGVSVSSNTMGGDLIDAVSIDNSLYILLGDVSGHGVGAGVVMAMLKSCIRTRLLHCARLAEVVSDANKVLTELTASNMFATFVALRLSPDYKLEYALAGHLPVFHYRAAASRWDRYPNRNLPLGIDSHEQFESGSTDLAPGDILALFTDGVMEVQDTAGRELGIAGVASLLDRSLSPSLPAMYESLMTAVRAHGAQLDDQSLVLIRVK